MEKDSVSFSSLVSRESERSSDEDTKVCTSEEEEEEEYVLTLMERESESGVTKDQSLAFHNLVKRPRLEAIAWTLKARAVFGFQFQTAYLSMTYFDRFLSKRPINSEEMWVMRLLPVACLALAAKMEEAEIPSLSEFRSDGDDFGTKLIERMELFVLSTLEWKMSSITPFAFLHLFITRLCQFDQSHSPPNHNILSTTNSLIMASIREINLMEHRASSIAAAATLVASGQKKLTKKSLEIKLNPISLFKSVQVEDVFSCYNKMSELKIYRETSGLSMIRSKQTGDLLETSSVTNAFGNERKRLSSRKCSFECGMTGYKRFR